MSCRVPGGYSGQYRPSVSILYRPIPRCQPKPSNQPRRRRGRCARGYYQTPAHSPHALTARCLPIASTTRHSKPTYRSKVPALPARAANRSEEHTSELQSRFDLVCRLLLEKKKKEKKQSPHNKTYAKNNYTTNNLKKNIN